MITKSVIYVFAIQCALAYPFPAFQLRYKLTSPSTIELQTVYTGFQIVFIKYSNSASYHSISNYLSNRINHIQIQGLEPCTKYEISVVVHNLQYNVEFTHTENITTTTAPEFSIKVQSTVPTSNVIYIELNVTRPQCIGNLYVILDDIIRLVYTKENITKQLIISDLEPCTHYHMEIDYNLPYNSTVYNIYDHYVKTIAGVLETPQNLKFDSDINLFTWGPIGSENCPVNYIITIEPDDKSKQNHDAIFTGESMINKYNFSFLAKCSQFRVTIHPEGRIDLSRAIRIVTAYKEPGPVTNVSMDVRTKNMLSIKWDTVRDNSQCITYFDIKVNDAVQTTTNEFDYLVDESKFSTISNISVCLITQHSTEKCAQLKASEIKNVSAITVYSDINMQQTIITWNDTNSADIRHYDVTLVKDSILENYHVLANFNTVAIPILTLCESYQLHIKTIPIFKQASVIESNFRFKTGPQKPIAPEEPRLLTRTTSSLTMKSLYSNPDDKCEIEMFRFLCYRGPELRSTDDENGNGVISNLKKSAVYNCSVMVKNELGWSNSSKYKMFSTYSESVQYDLYAHSISHNSIGISWTNHFISIKLTISKVKNEETVSDCKFVEYTCNVTMQTSRRKYKFKNLEPHTNYSIQAVAPGSRENTAKEIIVTTSPDVPHQVKNLRIINSTRHSVTFSWKLPCSLNGRVKGFVVKTREPHSESFLPFDSAQISTTFYFTANQSTMLGHRMDISVGIKLFNLVGPLNESTIIFHAPISDWLNDWVEIFVNDSTHALLNIKNETFILGNDSVTRFTLVISDRECHTLETDDVSSLISTKNDCIQQCHFRNVPNTVKITLIEGAPQICLKSGGIELKRGANYAILARIITSKGYTDTFPIVFKTNQIQQSSFNFIMIFLLLLVCLVFIILSVTTGAWYCKNYITQTVRRENPTYIEVQFYPDFYKLIDQSFIANEYKSINDMNLSTLSKTIAEYYPAKNRYKDIIPYDYNRVILRPNEYCTTDYINASYIDGEKQRDEYLAAQGPKENTAYDFWHMVIEKHCDKIVMLTQLTEDDVAKCYKYYPNDNETLEFYDIAVTNANETNFDEFIRRELIVQRDQSIRSIIQYQFMAWPDYECPRNDLGLIEFIEFTKNEIIKSTNPVVVHCSAGVGRTGTFIALDILLQSFRNDKYISIFDTVRKLRVQRCQMVQTVEQYKYLYALVNAYFHRRIYK